MDWEQFVPKWEYRDGSLVPPTTNRPGVPTRVLRIVSCGCKTGCRKTCGCRKAGLYCTAMCCHCNGQTCSSMHVLVVSHDSDDDSLRCECDNSGHVSVLNFVCALLCSFFLLFVSVSIIYAYAYWIWSPIQTYIHHIRTYNTCRQNMKNTPP